MGKNKHQTEWERAINLMTDEELQFIREHEIGYDPGFLDLVWEKKLGDVSSYIPENKAMMDAIINILGNLGCQCEICEDDEIYFCYHTSEFSIRFDENFDYIKIIDNSWKTVDLNDSEATLKMSIAINRANAWHNVTIAFIIDEEEHVMDVFSSSNMPYFPNYTYLKKFLHNKLVELLSSHNLVDRFLQDEEEMAIEESFSQTPSREAN
jgi:hypothetical protein